jgi:hypothetical protein
MVIILIVLVSIMANLTPRYEDQNPAFKTYIELFEFYYGKKTTSGMQFRELDEGIVGTCYHGTKSIAISPEYWKYALESEKIVLIFHELAHCELGRDHLEDIFTDGCPQSILYPSVLSRYCFDKHQLHYFNEVFSWNMFR